MVKPMSIFRNFRNPSMLIAGSFFIPMVFCIQSCNAQQSSETNCTSIDFRYDRPLSFKTKFMKTALKLSGMKKQLEKRMVANGLAKIPANPPRSLMKRFTIREIERDGRKVWTISPIAGKTDIVILYLHGGAYMGSISDQHWGLIERLLCRVNAIIVVPDYPLAPESTCKETFGFVDKGYQEIVDTYPGKRIILMGDSAGGGLALGFAQQLRNESREQPADIILFSPWLDITMNNPDERLLDKHDDVLSIRGLKYAAQKYAGNSDLKDFRVSPVYGDFKGMGKISIFTGTSDILNADARRCRQLLRAQDISCNYFEYPGMFHGWMMVESLKESRDVVNKVVELVKAD